MPSSRKVAWTEREPPPALDVRTILERTTDCAYVVDRDWRVTYLNPRAAAEMIGGRDLVGMDLWEAFPNLEASTFGRTYRRAMATGKVTETEAFYAPNDTWYRASAFPFPDGVAIFFRNVPARKRSEAALRASEQRFRALFERLTQGVLFQDRDGFVIDANPAAEAILGVSLDEMRNLPPGGSRWQALDDEGQPLDESGQNPTREALRTGIPVRDRTISIFNPKRGERRWLRIDAIPQFLPGEAAPHQVHALFSDDTDRHLAELALRESERHLARAQRFAAVGSGEIDFRTGSRKWSDETYRIHGLDKAGIAVSDALALSLVHPDDREKYLAGVESVRNGIVPEPIEYRIIRPDGQVRTLYREAEIIRDAAGTPVGSFSTKRDVTELRAAQRQREEMQTQLLHAQRLDALGTLAGGMAHDLNNALVPIIALSSLALESAVEGGTRHGDLKTIFQAGLQAQELVRKILAFSRKEPPQARLFSLADVTREALGLVRASVPSSIRIDRAIEEVPPLHGDPSQLHQVIVNLATNAAQAIGERAGTIAVALRPAEAVPVPSVALVFEDTGDGMDEATLDRIFEPFFTTRAVGEGTGLGMSMVHGIVTGHRGTIQIRSAPGRGTRVEILLPLAPPEAGGASAERNAP